MSFTLVTENQLTQAAALIRSNPSLDRDGFYTIVEQAFGAEVDETKMQQVTQALVDLGFVPTNHYDYIAPWIRSQSDAQLTLNIEAIHNRYLKNMEPVVLDYQIETADQVISDHETKLALVDTMILENSDEEERTELLTLLRGTVDATIQATTRRKTELEQKRAMYPE